MRTSRAFAALLAGVLLAAPFAAFALPFGGATGAVIPCYNDAIWTTVGPPRGGIYIWTPATITYEFGPPTHPGQWLLGLASAPYYCLVSILPIIVFPGIAIIMMGSSGPSAPTASPSVPPVSAVPNSPTPGMTPAQVQAAEAQCNATPGCIWN